jgi:hypothetical protein
MNKRLFTILASFFFTTFYSFGQINVVGKIVDNDGNPVFPATIQLSSNHNYAVISDIEGGFKIAVEKASINDSLIISCLGYKTAIYPINKLIDNENSTIYLDQIIQELSEVIVFSSPSITKEFAVEKISSTNIYMTPGASADPLKAVSISVYSTNTSETANPELRGSSGDYSRVVMNGVPIYKPVRNQQLSGLGNFSVFNLELIDKLDIYAGNPPLEYGNSIAGLIDIETKNNLDCNSLTISASLATVGALCSYRLNNHSFIQAYGNYQFSSPYKALNPSLDYINSFQTLDGGFNYRNNFSKYLFLNIYSYLINEEYSSIYHLYNYSGDSDAKKKRNFNIINLVWQKNNSVISLNNGTDFSKSNYIFGNIEENHVENNIYNSIDLKHFFLDKKITTQLGISHDYSYHKYGGYIPVNYWLMDDENYKRELSENIEHHTIETYFYSKFIFTNNLICGAGVRKNIPTSNQNSYISYQFNAKYNLSNKHSLLLSMGKYYGYSIPEYNIRSISEVSSQQYSIDYSLRLNRNLKFAASVYQKKESSPKFFSEDGEIINTDTQFRGIELSTEYKYKNTFDVSLSYSFLDSKFKTPDSNNWQRYYNDIPILLKFSASYYNKIANIGLNVTNKSGEYYTPVTDSFVDDSAIYPLFGDYYSARLNNYFSVDLTFNRYFKVKNTGVVVYASINNILNCNNQRYVYYSKDFSQKHFKEYQNRMIYFGVRFTIE